MIDTKIIDGRELALLTRRQLKKDVSEFIKKTSIVPKLTVILVGENPASKIYVRNKKVGCEENGMISEIIRFESDISQEVLINAINELNNDDAVHGILVQLPLPKHIDEFAVIQTIKESKDVDGFSLKCAGGLFTGNHYFVPCTPLGCMELIKSTGHQLDGKHAVVVGRSNIVGKPISMLLLESNATVTICHSKTKDLEQITKQADILIAAVGIPKLIKRDMIKEGCIVIDVGINRTEQGLCGDVDFDGVMGKAGYITPVPGGVGPMTITMLLKNTLEAAKCSKHQ